MFAGSREIGARPPTGIISAFLRILIDASPNANILACVQAASGKPVLPVRCRLFLFRR